MSLTWPNQHLMLADRAELPGAEGARVELVEGLVVMTPMPRAGISTDRRCCASDSTSSSRRS